MFPLLDATVRLVRTMHDGTTRTEKLVPAAAVAKLLADGDNGLIYYSGHIEGDASAWPLGYELGKPND